mmetsp:Transcript_7649/g.10899  ORF Transcript_7649/g.10899 Transcript_7649/m.10899 type:complete len:501 (+) Transcript_7649:213-1715(+)
MSYNMGGQMNSRSMLWERIRIQVEIACETISDMLGGSGGIFRKPLVLLAGLALFMTMRSAKRGVSKMKRAGYTSTGMGYGTYGSSSKSMHAGGYGTGSTRGGLGGFGSSSLSGLGGTTGGYGRSTLGGSTTGHAGSLGATGGLGGSTSAFGAGSYGAGAMTGELRGSTTGTASLADQHGPSLRVLENDMFKSYGQISSFGGQIETLQAYDGAGVVEKVLQSPGTGKVLVVDGGGNLRSAILDGIGASTAQRNGWAGIIVNGAIRNADTIATTPIGVKALGTNPIKGTATQGNKGSTVTIGGLQLSSGMWLHADKDGIVVSNQQLASGGSSTMGGGGISSVGGGSSFGTNTGFGAGASTLGGGNALGGNTMGGNTMVGNTMGGATGYGTAGGATGYGANARMASTTGYGGANTGYGANYGYGANNGYGANSGVLSSLFGSKSSSGYGGSNSLLGTGKSAYGPSSYGTYGGGGGYGRSKNKMMKYIGIIALVLFVYSFISPN